MPGKDSFQKTLPESKTQPASYEKTILPREGTLMPGNVRHVQTADTHRAAEPQPHVHGKAQHSNLASAPHRGGNAHDHGKHIDGHHLPMAGHPVHGDHQYMNRHKG